MEREIVLSSYSVKNIPGNKAKDFVTKFNKPIILNNNIQHVIGLNRIINMSFTWFNVNPSYKIKQYHIVSIMEQTFKILFFHLVFGIILILIAISIKKNGK